MQRASALRKMPEVRKKVKKARKTMAAMAASSKMMLRVMLMVLGNQATPVAVTATLQIWTRRAAPWRAMLGVGLHPLSPTRMRTGSLGRKILWSSRWLIETPQMLRKMMGLKELGGEGTNGGLHVRGLHVRGHPQVHPTCRASNVWVQTSKMCTRRHTLTCCTGL